MKTTDTTHSTTRTVSRIAKRGCRLPLLAAASHPTRLLASFLCATLALVQSASAASQTWQGDVSTDWATTGNWVGNAVPGIDSTTADVATFNDANTVSTAVTLSASRYIGTVTITGTKSYTFGMGTFYFTNEAAFTNSSSGTITLSGDYRGRRNGNSTFTNTGGLVTFSTILKEAPTAADSGDLIFDGSGNFQVTSLGKRNGDHLTDLVKNGAGTLTITGFRTTFATTGTSTSGLTGITTINNGTVRITSGDARSLGKALSNRTNWLTLNGGTLQVSTSDLNLGVNATEGVSLGASGGKFNVDANRNLTIGGAGGVNLISGSGALTKLGDGTLTLSGANTYSGDTTISAGALTLANGGSLLMDINDGSSNRILGDGTLTLDGRLNLDIAGVTDSGNWNIVSVGTLAAVNYGATFSIAINGGSVFTETAPDSGVWVYAAPFGDWTFTESTGILNYNVPMGVDNDGGPTSLSPTTATLNGRVISSGGFALETLRIYFGENNPGQQASGWSVTNDITLPVTQLVPFSTNVTGLLYGKTYYYAVYATNAVGGEAWSAVTNFVTLPPPGGTGGTVTNYTQNGTNFFAQIFTESGEFEPLMEMAVEVLVVGGGGGGNGTRGGGGGGGAVVTEALTVAPGAHAIVVGTGGGPGANGMASTALGFTAGGGGAGGVNTTPGNPGTDGSSGGGSGFDNNAAIGIGLAGGLGDPPGKNGGAGYKSGNFLGAGGGGGGAGGNGAAASNNGGNGGVGGEVWGGRYAGGGGGGTRTGTAGTAVDGGGAGGYGDTGSGTEGGKNGTPNTGGGGGGSGGGGTGTPAPAGTGGSGIVIVRYQEQAGVVANTAASNITSESAEVAGILNATQSVFTVYAYYSTNNLATAQAWLDGVTAGTAFKVAAGSYTNVMGHAVTGTAVNLLPNTDYYYTLMATNAATSLWASPNTTFKTAAGPTVPYTGTLIMFLSE